jgi:hypothetical protein
MLVSGLNDCRGKGRGGKCTNACQDCGDVGEWEDRCPGEIVKRGGDYVQGCPSQRKCKKSYV